MKRLRSFPLWLLCACLAAGCWHGRLAAPDDGGEAGEEAPAEASEEAAGADGAEAEQEEIEAPDGSFCGNGVVEEGEQCDEGGRNSDVLPDACRKSCVRPACGDGVKDTGEECDDGERNSDRVRDACRTDCRDRRCGDGVVDSGEGCDDGDTDDNDECTNGCALPSCGDGIVSTGEECDDGDEDDTDECLSTCTDAVCGDRRTRAGVEECDGNAPVDCTTSCGSHGFSFCAGCAWGGCEPPMELCNGRDDDCDGTCDDGFACCAGAADLACVNAGGAAGTNDCDALCALSPCCSALETCGNVHDDDCDGSTDESGVLVAATRLTSSPWTSSAPSAAWTGSEFGVAWEDERDADWEIYFARVSAAGTKIGADARVTSAARVSSTPSLAWSGSEFGVAWQDMRDGNFEIYFARIDAAGAKAGGDVRVTAAGGNSVQPSLVAAGSGWGVAWQDDRNGAGNYEIYFVLLTAAGAAAAPELRVTNAAGFSRDAALVSTGGTGFAVAWDDARDGPLDIWLARIGPGGALAGAETRVTSDPYGSWRPSLLFTGTALALAWTDDRNVEPEIYMTFLTPEGARTGPDTRLTESAGTATAPVLKAASGGKIALCWSDSRGGDFDIYMTELRADGSRVGADERITKAERDSWSPSIAWTGSRLGIAWRDDRDSPGNGEIYFTLAGCL